MFQEKCSNKLRLKFSITLIGNDFFSGEMKNTIELNLR